MISYLAISLSPISHSLFLLHIIENNLLIHAAGTRQVPVKGRKGKTLDGSIMRLWKGKDGICRNINQATLTRVQSKGQQMLFQKGKFDSADILPIKIYLESNLQIHIYHVVET
jgi:hypothetical protein